jgi:Tol biopolymer transport system component
MQQKFIVGLLMTFSVFPACWWVSKNTPASQISHSDSNPLIFPNEKHFAHVRQLTREGENSAEAYFSFGKQPQRIIFQSTRPPFHCDQIFILDLNGEMPPRLVSTGKGRTTCGYFLANNEHIIYASTHLGGDTCPPPPSFARGYVWALYPDYDIFMARDDGSDLRQLTKTNGYDAEATISPDGKKIVFTSLRDGDLEIYTMNIDGTDVRRLTHTPGYDGGAFFSPEGSQIIYRAYHPKSPDELADYQSLLKENLIRPSKLEIFVMNADGSKQRQITNNGAANFAPFFHPGGKKIIFCSNVEDPKHRNFDLYLIDIDGSNQERVTYCEDFDGFPMFSPDGKKLVFCSNRNAAAPRQTNVFIADWVE